MVPIAASAAPPATSDDLSQSGTSHPAAAASAAPLEAYGHLPTIEDVAISPDGQTLAYVTNVGSDRLIQVQSLADHTILDTIRAGRDKLRSLDWADNTTLLITVSNTRYFYWSGAEELFATISCNIRTRTLINVLGKAEHAAHVEAGLPQPRSVNGRTRLDVPGATLSGLSGVLTMFEVDPDTGNATELDAGTKHTEGFVVDDGGKVVARADYDDDKRHWSLLMKRGAVWSEVYGVDAAIETPDLLGLGPDGKTVLVQTIEGGRRVYRQFSIADGTPEPPLNADSDASSLVYDPVTRHPIGVLSVGDHYRYTFFSAADQAAWNSVAHAFSGEDVQLVSWSGDRKRIIALVTGKRDGASYQIVDLNAGRADLLGHVYANIKPDSVAEVRAVSYTAGDGLRIPAFLTLPSGRPAQNLPLIVLPHGGPAARDMPGFDWWAQALASRGYAVLQPEFRGSDGYGWEFLAAGFGEWGRKMQTDLSDGVSYLAAQGTIDPKRVCIVGASYGGYAALAGATLQHGIYRCAVSVAGISDPMNILSHRAGEGRDERYLERFFGVSGYSDRKLDEVAPLAHVSQADIPILLIHGTHDSVVSYLQSQYMHDAMTRDGKPVTMILLDSEDHWLSLSGTRQLMLSETVKFLEKYNPPG
jgi:dipeptidyl aminopeptidase/acylaminoacyl peptidase